MNFSYLTEGVTYTTNNIPKIIHQTWKNDRIPDNWKISNEKWREFHPDWKYMLWTDDLITEYMHEKHPEFLSIYKKYPYNIQRADAMRYFILYDYGGVYSDLDMYPLENIEKYIEDVRASSFFIFSANSACFTNSFMISQKGAPIWLEVQKKLREKVPWYAFGKHLHVMLSTGPLMLDWVLRNSNESYSVLPRLKFNPYAETEIGTDKPGTVIKSLMGKSWHSFDSTVYDVINGNKVFFITLGIAIIFLVIGLAIYLTITYYRLRHMKCDKVIDYCYNPMNTSLENIDVS